VRRRTVSVQGTFQSSNKRFRVSAYEKLVSAFQSGRKNPEFQDRKRPTRDSYPSIGSFFLHFFDDCFQPLSISCARVFYNSIIDVFFPICDSKPIRAMLRVLSILRLATNAVAKIHRFYEQKQAVPEGVALDD